MISEVMKSTFETVILDQAFFDGKPGLDAETKAVMMVLFSEEYMMSIFDYCGDLLGGEE